MPSRERKPQQPETIPDISVVGRQGVGRFLRSKIASLYEIAPKSSGTTRKVTLSDIEESVFIACGVGESVRNALFEHNLDGALQVDLSPGYLAVENLQTNVWIAVTAGELPFLGYEGKPFEDRKSGLKTLTIVQDRLEKFAKSLVGKDQSDFAASYTLISATGQILGQNK